MNEGGRVTVGVEGQTIEGTILTPEKLVPGILFVHGWGGSQEHDLARARKISRLGCLCFTFDLRGHAATEPMRETVTREQNLADLLAAYDFLAGQPAVDKSAIAVVGSSYGGYLAAILTSLRPVNWLALRVPALYRDEDWDIPKAALDRDDLNTYRQTWLSHSDNRALRACSKFEGDVLIVESECDEIVPHPAVGGYTASFRSARSLTYRMIKGADHALSAEKDRAQYNKLLNGWITTMVLGARLGD